LYIWNARLSEAFYFPLQCAEVVLRNSIHEVLTDLYDPDWPTHPEFALLVKNDDPDKDDLTKNIEKVQKRIQRAGYPVVTSRIVSGLSFDFWATLLYRRYDRLIWQTRLHRTFPNLPGGMTRRDVEGLVNDVKAFRNRIAHHEPILRANHSMVHTNILRLIRFRCPETAAWVNYHSRVQSTLRERP
jgi:hypothetical protein